MTATASMWRMRLGVLALWLGLSVAALGAAEGLPPSASPIRVVDARGATVAFDSPPQRIVSLLPSLTESVCALGACERLVGTDRYSNWPASLDSVPKVGGGIDPNIEAVVALEPDLVLLAPSSRAAPRLAQLRVKVLLLEPKNQADVKRVLNVLGQVLRSGDAATVWQGIQAEVTDAAQSLPVALHGLRVYFEINSAPYAAGESSFIGENLASLGVANIVPAALGPFPKLNPEYVVRANPALIMVGERGAQGLPQRPGWAAIDAVRHDRICRFTPAQSDVLVRPGPRMGEAARIMASCLRDKGGL